MHTLRALSMLMVVFVALSSPLTPSNTVQANIPPLIAHSAATTDLLTLAWSASAANYTQSIAWGDVDGDGDLDLAVGNQGRQGLYYSQLYRNDNGTFTLIWSPTEADATTSVAWGDMDGDGDLDLAVGNDGQNRLYRNDGGTLTKSAVWSSTESDNTTSLAWGDVDGDGDLDLAVGNTGPIITRGEANRLYRNDRGMLTTSAVWSSAEKDATTSVAWGDVDGDGDLDLVVGNNNAPARLYRNDGGTLTTGAIWSSTESDSTSSVAWGDVDGDGDLDLILGNSLVPLRLYRNDGGTLTQSAVWSSTEAKLTYSVAWGDADGDGDLDLAVGNLGALNQLYRNDGGTLTNNAVWSATEAYSTTSVAWGDIDGDSDLDLAVGNTLFQPNLVYQNSGNTLTDNAMWSSTEANQITSVAWGDVDGDGDLDLAIGNKPLYDPQCRCYLGGENRLYRNDNGTLTPNAVWASDEKNTTTSLAWGDVDGDGDLDLAVGNTEANRLYRNDNGTLHLAWTSNGTDNRTQSVAWGDADGDGDLDLAVGTMLTKELYRNDNGTLTPNPVWTTTEMVNTYSVAWGDVDGDGDLDLATGNDGANYLYRNDNGTLTATAVWSSLETDDTRSLVWGDVDGDGDLDLVVGNNRAPNRLYRNDNGTLTRSAVWSSIEADVTSSIALGDMDGDGDLDLAVANGDNIVGTSPQGAPQPNRLYRNDGGTFTRSAVWSSTENEVTTSAAWGDVDGDGDLDLVVGNNGTPLRLYRNGAAGGAGLPNTPPSIALNRPGTANANGFSAAQVLTDTQLALPFTLVDREGDPVGAVRAAFSLDGGGAWQPAIPVTATSALTNLATLRERFTAPITTPLPIADLGTTTSALTIDPPTNGTVLPLTGLDVSLTISHTNDADLRVWLASPNGITVTLATHVGGTGAHFVSTTFSDMALTSISTGTAPFTATYRPTEPLSTFAGIDPIGSWTLHVADDVISNTGALVRWGLRLHTPGVQHTFTWDTFASRFFGQNDHVVVRLEALPGGILGPNNTPLFQRPRATATTFPFRLRGTQVRVLDAQGRPVSQTLVLRRGANNDTFYPISGLNESDPLGVPTVPVLIDTIKPLALTDAQGYLRGQTPIALGDQLIALAPISTTDAYSNSYTLFATNMLTSSAGIAGTAVSSPGVQTLVVSLDRPFMLFHLDLSLEWDARNDAQFMGRLTADLRRASELLFDETNGQAALGDVTIFHDKENWDVADIRVYASNQMRPNATIGGVATQDFSETITLSTNVTHTLMYGPGQVAMGATWNRFGNAGSTLSEDWARTLVHELGHYLFFLDDAYLGRDAKGLLIPVDSCPGVMADQYASPFEVRTSADWLPACNDTLANQATGRADWRSLQQAYPALHTPTVPFTAGAMLGPSILPMAATAIFSADPLTPTERLSAPIFYTRLPSSEGGGRYTPSIHAQAILFQDTWVDTETVGLDRLTPLGRPTNDQVLARGARDGDRLCVFDPDPDPTRTDEAPRQGCERLRLGDEHIALTATPDWRPAIRITPINSVTLALTVTNLFTNGLPLQAQLYPLDNRTMPPAIDLQALGGGVYTGTFILAEPLDQGALHLFRNVPEDTAARRDSVMTFSLGGNPGFIRNGSGFIRNGGGFIRNGGGFIRNGGGFIRNGGGFIRNGGGFIRNGGGFIRNGNTPVASAEGGIMIETGNDDPFKLGQFLLIQSATQLPPIPAWTTLIGQAYQLIASPDTPDLAQASVSISYLGSDVPAGEETGISVYYLPNGSSTWQRVPTTLNTYHNLAAAAYQDAGIYAAMSSLPVPLRGSGWNLVGYPVQATRPVTEALASIGGHYNQVYTYVTTDTQQPWRLYSPGAPDYVNDLSTLEFGRGYWINITDTQALTIEWKGAGLASPTAPEPPMTMYGNVAPIHHLAVGQIITAWVGNTVCGQGTVRQFGSQLVYRVAVETEDGATFAGCGLPGRTVILRTGGVVLGQVAWTRAHTTRLDLDTSVEYHVYLPMLRRE